MSDYDDLTRDDLIAALEQAAENVGTYKAASEELTQERNAWRAAKAPDKEAEAIAACVRALDIMLAPDPRPSNRDVVATAMSVMRNGTSPVSRVLLFLAQRFDAQLPPAPELPERLEVRIAGDCRDGDYAVCYPRAGYVERVR